jgi:hypothetical protein
MPKPTADEVDQIEALLLTKQWSGKQIAELLGRSRNSVVGIIWRTPHLKEIGLPNEQPEALRKITEARRASSERRMRWAPPHERPDYVKPGPRTLLNLRRDDCKYVVDGEGVGALFCAEPKTGDGPYCLKHYRVCHVPVRSASNGR